MVELSVTADTRGLEAAFRTAGRRLPVAIHKVTVDHGYKGLAFIRRNASGRPGPNAPTGDYKRSWGIRFGLDGSVTVGTNAVQGRRLEKGFTGTDSLGRKYRQRAYPHVAPAARQLGPLYQRAVLQAIASEVRRST